MTVGTTTIRRSHYVCGALIGYVYISLSYIYIALDAPFRFKGLLEMHGNPTLLLSAYTYALGGYELSLGDFSH